MRKEGYKCIVGMSNRSIIMNEDIKLIYYRLRPQLVRKIGKSL